MTGTTGVTGSTGATGPTGPSVWTRLVDGTRTNLYYNDGFVGIGHTVPTTNLDVSGSFRMTGNMTTTGTSKSIFSGESVFSRISQSMVEVNNNIFDFTLGNSFLSTNAAGGPYTYNLRNVPDLSTNSHIFTIFNKANAANFSNCYASSIIVNSTTPYTIKWANGDDPVFFMKDVSNTDILTQQLALLPSNAIFGNSAISHLTYYR